MRNLKARILQIFSASNFNKLTRLQPEKKNFGPFFEASPTKFLSAKLTKCATIQDSCKQHNFIKFHSFPGSANRSNYFAARVKNSCRLGFWDLKSFPPSKERKATGVQRSPKILYDPIFLPQFMLLKRVLQKTQCFFSLDSLQRSSTLSCF